MFQTLCLNMIVKNEAHIICKTLENITNKLKIDYYVISDTGSEDNTKELITTFFTNKNIKGEIFDDKWSDFGHNRTLALNHAINKTDYLLIFDADDEIVGDINIKYGFDIYDLNIKSGNTIYNRPLIINNRKKFKFTSVLHEYLECCEPNPSRVKLNGDYYVISGRMGARSKNPNKYLDDALVLEKAFNEITDEQVKTDLNSEKLLKTRYAFYCANSYKDHKLYDKAIEWYKKTVNLDGWVQEKYYSCMRLFECFCIQQNQEAGIVYLIQSYKYDPERVECIYELVRYYLSAGMNQVAYNFYLLIEDTYNKNISHINTMPNKLFLDISIYYFYLPYYMIIVALNLNKPDTAKTMFNIIMTYKQVNIDQWFIKNIFHNLKVLYNTSKLSSDTEFTKVLLNYIGFLKDNNYNMAYFDKLSDIYIIISKSDNKIKLDNLLDGSLNNHPHNSDYAKIIENIDINNLSKINKIDHIVWINLERSKDRRNYMEKILDNIPIKNTRINAVDGNLLKDTQNKPSHLSNSEFGCVLSHIKAINYLSGIQGEYFLILEDDMGFDNLKYFEVDLGNIINNAPKFDILMLTKITLSTLSDLYTDVRAYTNNYTGKTNNKLSNDDIWSAGAYVITKEAIAKFCKIAYYNDEIKADSNSLYTSVHSEYSLDTSELFIYKHLDTIAYKYNFITSLDINSEIHNNHLDYHRQSSKIASNLIIDNFGKNHIKNYVICVIEKKGDWEEDFIINDLLPDNNIVLYADTHNFINETYYIKNNIKKNKCILVYSSNRVKYEDINRIAEFIRPISIFHLSDMYGNRQNYNNLAKHTQILYRQYYHKSNIIDDNLSNKIKYMPLGYMTGMLQNRKNKSSLDLDLIELNKRKYIFGFIGNNSEIIKCINKDFNNSNIMSSYMDAPDTYKNYSNSIFVACQRYTTLNVFSIYEACIAGAIPVIVGSEEELEEFKYEENNNWIFADTWPNALNICAKLLENNSDLKLRQTAIFNWWKNRVNTIRRDIKQVIKNNM
jgi:GR25 family glycosyltransferase involved in LPS biosynthesis